MKVKQNILSFLLIDLTCNWDFPNGIVVKTPASNAENVGSIPGQETKIPCTFFIGSSLVVELVKKKIHPQCRRPWLNSWVRKIRWRRDKLPTPVFLGFPGGSEGKESTCSAGDLG